MKTISGPSSTSQGSAVFEGRIRTQRAVVGVIGLGYVGLPLAVAYARRGFRVVGFDLDQGRVHAINAGASHIGDVRSDDLAGAVAEGRLRASTDQEELRQTDVVFICVPTPCTRNKEPDTSYIKAATEGIAANLKQGHLVILRSTSFPGTTEELVRPLLERNGYRVGRDIYLAFAPERVDPGRKDYTVQNTPVLVGGCDTESTRRAAVALGVIADQVIPMSSPAAAEMAKLLENVFRNVNIALVNQLAMLCDRMSLDIWEITEAAATKPYGFLSFHPGPGVGGHCIPVDPYYLAWKAREYDFHMDFIELAARVNDEMPYYVATKVLLALKEETSPGGASRVLVLGVAFKRDIEDYRDSPALKVMELLHRRGVEIAYHDPYVPVLPFNGEELQSEQLTARTLRSYDCVIVATDHSAFDYDWIVRHAKRVFDTRNATSRVLQGRERIIRL